MRAAEDLVLPEPLGVHRSEEAERDHRVLAVEHVVDEPLEVVRVVAVRHHVRRVRVRQAERVRELVRLLRERGDLLQARLVAELLEVRVVGRDARRREELDHAGLGQRVEVAAQQELRVRRVRLVARPERLPDRLLGQLLQLRFISHGQCQPYQVSVARNTSFMSIIVCTSFTSQYCGSQWMCAVHTRSGWWICDGSGRMPDFNKHVR